MAASVRRGKAALAHLLGTGRDLVGPPDALTNLRPVYRAPKFTSPQPSAGTRKLHPYSLDEFGSRTPVISSSTLLPGSRQKTAAKQQARLARLEAVRSTFEAEDLAWRLQQRRLEQVSHEHWARSNSAFAKAKNEAEDKASMGSLSLGSPDSFIMEDFHKRWLEDNAQEYERYQQTWLRGIFAHIPPAARAVYRDWRWKFEVWRAGVPQTG